MASRAHIVLLGLDSASVDLRAAARSAALRGAALAIDESSAREGAPSESLRALLAEAHVIVLLSGGLSCSEIEIARRCVLVVDASLAGAAIDESAARAAGVPVVPVLGAATPEYAEAALGAIDCFLPAAPSPRRRRAPRLGIVGLGEVGGEVARGAATRGFEVWANDPFAPRESFVLARVRRAELLDLLGIVDVVSIHLPLHSSTRGLIGLGELGLMHQGASIVNTSDPAIVDVAALAKLLDRGRLACAFLADGGRPDLCGQTGPERSRWNRLIETGKLRLLELEFERRPRVIGRSVDRALAIALDYLEGSEAPRLLVDPPLPRLRPALGP